MALEVEKSNLHTMLHLYEKDFFRENNCQISSSVALLTLSLWQASTDATRSSKGPLQPNSNRKAEKVKERMKQITSVA